MEDPLTNTLRPSTSAILTVRIIKSFAFRTTKNLILRDLDLTTTTVGMLKERARNEMKTAAGWKPYRTTVLDELKLYTKAHGSKTMNLIINTEDDPSLFLTDDSKTLSEVGLENESEVSFFERKLYDEWVTDPQTGQW